METKDVLKNATVEAITEVMNFVRATTNFAIEQAPDLAQQLLAYSATAAWAGLLYCSTWLIISFAGVGVLVLVYKYVTKGENVDSEATFMGCAFGGIVFCVGLLGFILSSKAHVLVLIKVYTAPKLFILEKLASLI